MVSLTCSWCMVFCLLAATQIDFSIPSFDLGELKDLVKEAIGDKEVTEILKNVSGESVEKNLRTRLFENYTKEIRPSKTNNITVLFSILSINYLDTKSQTLSTTGYFEMMWEDLRLKWSSSQFDVSEIFVEQSDIWIPPIIINNEVNKYSLIADGQVPIRLESSGSVIWTQPRLMHTSCAMNIRYYPFDTQICSIVVNPWAYTLNELDFIVKGTSVTKYVENGEWDVSGYNNKKNVENEGDHRVPVIMFEFELKRRPSYYVQNVIVPFVVMSCLSPVAFILPAESGERVSFIITVFLAFAVMLTLIVDQLPASSRQPSIMSEFLTFTTVNASLVVLLTITNLHLHHRPDAQPVAGWMKMLVKPLQKILLRKRTSNKKVEPSESENGEGNNNPSPGNDAVKAKCAGAGGPTWKEVSGILDMFYFRLFTFVTLASVCGLILTLLLNRK